MLLQFDTLIFWRESQISFALQLLFSSGNPCNLKDLNFGSLNLLLSSPITPSSSDLVPPMISFIFPQLATFISSRDLNFGSWNSLLSSPIAPSSSDLVPLIISIFPQLTTYISSRFTRQLQEDGTRISMLLQSCTSIRWRESQISFALQMLFSSLNPFNFSSLKFGSRNLLLSSPITPSSSDLVPTMISFIFPQESTFISSRFTRQLQEDGTRISMFTRQLQEDGTRISMLLHLCTSIRWRESQISFALQMLFSFGNPCNLRDLNFGSWNSLLSSPIAPPSSDLVPIISSIFSHCLTSILSRFTRYGSKTRVSSKHEESLVFVEVDCIVCHQCRLSHSAHPDANT
uniref:Uncharacterized protein n=1 Tax=Salix viminalis TaxID=40686 RepID=A0A6N2KBT0_SALVM